MDIFTPGQDEYDEHRLGFQTHTSHHPAYVVVARSAQDVAAGVRRAVDEGRRVTVQATGHGVGSTDDEAVLVDTSGLDSVVVHPERRTATVGAGARWGAVIAAAAEHGLAPLSGSSPGVGVAGYVVQGGLPILGRAHGWAADHVRAFEVVTADGAVQTVTDGDLGWALRGGGGSFGIVTSVEVELLPITTVHAGAIFWPADDARALLGAWRDWAADLPDAMSTSVAVVPLPDLEVLPPAIRGRRVVTVRVAFDGPSDEGERLVAPLRAVAEPLLDGVGEMPWTESGRIHSDPPGPAASLAANLALGELSDDDLDACLAAVTGGDVRRVVELRRTGGALNRSGSAGPVRRDSEWTAGTVSILVPGTTDEQVADARTRDAAFRESLAAHAVGRVANLLFEEGADPAAVRSAYTPADWARLRAVKAAVDPQDVFLASAPVPVG